MANIMVIIPYTLLVTQFQYPDILRQPAGSILTQFQQAGSGLIGTWALFAMSALAMLLAWLMLDARLKAMQPHSQTSGQLIPISSLTLMGSLGALAQWAGLARWVFVVPVLAETYAHGNPAAQQAAVVSFQLIHQFAGVVLGEHIGQVLTILYTVGLAVVLFRLHIIGRFMLWFGVISSGIYLLAQAELLATVLPTLRYWEPAGLVGSSLWLIWLLSLAVMMMRRGD